MTAHSDSSPAPHAPPSFLDQLNPEQRTAAEHLDGPVLVLAGAGTGKTRVLTARLAHILYSGRAWPSQMLCVTFTNKAAKEMQGRIGSLIGEVVEGMPWLGTFHSIGAKIIRRHAELVGLKSNFTILDTDDQIRLLKQILRAENIDDKRWPARTLAWMIDGWKNRALMPNKVPSGDVHDFANGKVLDLYRIYQDRLKVLNAVDFGDLLMLCIHLFQTNPEVLAEFQKRFKYILVDEYQDTNVAQYLWLRLLAQGHKNICCVGDDDQSIYGWRGAEVGNILRFEEDFPGAKVIRLERNYRSTPTILGAASGLITANEDRLGKTLWTEGEKGDQIKVFNAWDGQEEARIVTEDIENLHRDQHTLNEMAILVRTSAQMRAFEDRFLVTSLPYRVIGGPRFYERLEIRDAIAYLRVIASPDDDLAFERIVNKPKRGLGEATMKVLHGVARMENIPLTQAARSIVDTDELRPAARNSLRTLMDHFARWREMSQALPQPELAESVLDESGYTDMLQADKSIEAPGRLENLKELVRSMETFENLQGFLEHVSLVMDNEQAGVEDKINLMTLHAAKGLEFETVFLPGWEEGLFPSQRTLDEHGLTGLEEERRLAYVGLTRAKKRAIISHATNRQVFGEWRTAIPSRFLDEIPEEHVAKDLAEPAFGNFYGGKATSRSGGGSDRGGARQPRTPKVIDGVVNHIPDAPGQNFTSGMRVFHQKFGYGQVTQADGNKLQVAFEKAGTKKVIASFVEKA